jgi:molybdate transport system substrate-binding protein
MIKRFGLLLVLLFSITPAFAQTLTVFAASSLTDAFTEMATVFKTQNPNADIVFNFAGSSTLATQITQGAPADIFASADTNQMQGVVDAGLITGEAAIFTRNRLVVITPKDSAIQTLEDLAKPGTLLVLAAPDVPVGKYSRQVLENLNESYGADFSESVLANLVSEEPNVKQVATKVDLGEADTAIVYVTDTASLKNIRAISIPDDSNVIATYPIAVLKSALVQDEQAELAKVFVAFVLSNEGQAILANYGFITNP